MQIWDKNTAGRGTSKGKVLQQVCTSHVLRMAKKANWLGTERARGRRVVNELREVVKSAVGEGGLWWWSHYKDFYKDFGFLSA